MISQNSVASVLDAAHVEDVVNDFVSLKKRGANLLGLCPFHNEKTPSFTVSPTKNLYKCFGCGKGGNAVSFIMEHENYSFPEAIRYLAKKYGIEIEETEQTSEEKEKLQQKESLFIINEFAKEFFHDQLLNTDEGKSVGLSYFTNRGLQLNTIKEFNLGYSPMDSKSLIKRAEASDYKAEYLETLGLKTQRGNDFFRSRIIFPITNLSGKVIAFGGRTLSSDKKVPKYLNSPESEIYNKSKSLYGIYQAKSQIRKLDNCFLVEGYTDVLSLSQNNVKNVVASSGTALTTGQLNIIRRFCSSITFLYDGDNAGQKAALRGLPLALAEGFNVKIVPMSESQDPDSLVQELGASSFEDYLEEKKEDFIIYEANRIKTEFAKLPIEKSGAIQELLAILAHLKDTIKRSIYLKEISNILQIDEGSLVAQLNKNIRKLISQNNKDRSYRHFKEQEENFVSEKTQPSQGKGTAVPKEYYQEKDIIRILLLDGHKILKEQDCTVAELILENLNEVIDSFSNASFVDILKIYQNNITSGNQNLTLDFFINHDNSAIRNLALELAETPFKYANWSANGVELQTQKDIEENYDKDIQQALLRYVLKKMNDRVSEIQTKLKEEDLPMDKKKVLIKAYHKILDQRKNIADDLGTIIL